MLPEVESLKIQSLWLFLKSFTLREEPDISLSIVNSKACFYTNVLRVIITLKRGSAFNTRSNDFIRGYIEHVTSRKRKSLRELL